MYDPATEIVVTSGATEAMFAAILGLTDPGDEVIVFEPVYDSYIPNMQMAGVTPRSVVMRAPDWAFDPDELSAAFNERTRAIIINTPHNPTGKVFSWEELSLIADLCQRYNVIAITDEVYEHILFDGNTHTPMATLPGMAERTLTISSLGKTFSVTGWKVGWALGPQELITGLNRSHQFITFAVSSPLQAAAANALDLPPEYYENLHSTFQSKRDYLMDALQTAGFDVLTPAGSYFVMASWANIAPDHIQNDVQFAEWLITEHQVACIPPSAFYQEPNRQFAGTLARFAVCKNDETLQAAAERLKTIHARV
jgi:N-succinyldiaminopimelate aminotransferase